MKLEDFIQSRPDPENVEMKELTTGVHQHFVFDIPEDEYTQLNTNPCATVVCRVLTPDGESKISFAIFATLEIAIQYGHVIMIADKGFETSTDVLEIRASTDVEYKAWLAQR